MRCQEPERLKRWGFLQKEGYSLKNSTEKNVNNFEIGEMGLTAPPEILFIKKSLK